MGLSRRDKADAAASADDRAYDEIPSMYDDLERLRAIRDALRRRVETEAARPRWFDIVE